MRNKIIFFLSVTGILAGLLSAYLYGIEKSRCPQHSNRLRILMKKGSMLTVLLKATNQTARISTSILKYQEGSFRSSLLKEIVHVKGSLLS